MNEAGTTMEVTTNSGPLVSIITPAYNGERYLRQTAESVFRQTLGDWEWIIVNDGSTDSTAAIVDELAKDDRVVVVHQQNQGVSIARNAGIRLARAPFLAFLDADDIWYPENLQRKWEVLSSSENDGFALVHSDVEEIDGDGNPTGVRMTGRTGWVLRDLLLWDGPTVSALPCNAVVRAEVVNAIGGFDPDLSTAADQDLLIRICESHAILRIPELLVRYREHSAGMHKNIDVMERDHLLVYKKAALRGAFGSTLFRRECFSRVYLIVGASWWKDAHDRARAIRCALRGIATWPPSAFRLLRRMM